MLLTRVLHLSNIGELIKETVKVQYNHKIWRINIAAQLKYYKKTLNSPRSVVD